MTAASYRLIPRTASVFLALATLLAAVVEAEKPLHQRIDELLSQRPGPIAKLTDDAGFLRRVSLDLIGRIPSKAEFHVFLADKSPKKRALLVERLLASPEHPQHMSRWFHILLMERRGDDPEWMTFLLRSFQQNKPWDKLVSEILNPDSTDEQRKGAAFFYTRRLTKVGQQPTDFPGLTTDVARLFLGQDLQCAQCHDHLFIDDYKQVDFQGLYSVFAQLTIRTDLKFPAVKEKKIAMEQEFISVFDPTKRATPPRVPNGLKATIPEPPKPKATTKKKAKTKTPKEEFGLSGTEWIASALPDKRNGLFRTNIANRIWHMLIGRGIVHPPDLHHSDNPASHPKLLVLLADEFASHDFDLRWLIKEIVLTETYQLASHHDKPIAPETFRIAHQRRLSAEQLMASVLQALGEKISPVLDDDKASDKTKPVADEGKKNGNKMPSIADIEQAFISAFANTEKEPEYEISSTVKSSLFLLNSDVMNTLLSPRPGNLLERVAKLNDTKLAADELFISILSRLPTPPEREDVSKFIDAASSAEKGIRDAAWALFGSVEFFVNH